MKNLKLFGLLVAMCGMLGSCGIPMATVRSVMKSPETASNALNTVYGGL